MSARESRGLEVALILFVMISIVLSISTYAYFRRSEERRKEIQSARADAKQAQDACRAAIFETQILKHVLGHEHKTDAELAAIRAGLGANPALDQVVRDFDQDLAEFQPAGGPEERNYRQLVRALRAAIVQRNAQLADANAQLNRVEAEKKSLLAAEAARTTVAEAGQQQAQTQLVAAQQDFDRTRKEFVEQTNGLADRIRQKNLAYQQLAATSQGKVEKVGKERDRAVELVKARDERLRRLEIKPPERPAGEVTAVSEPLQLVWINLGRADGLQPRMTFSIYEPKTTSLATAKSKGRIEVTRVTQDHLAEARIIENPLADPILAGDKIASPAFRKGQKTHFALVGLLDIDGDGKSDQARVKALIELNGGVVDAELREDGTIVGRMTLDTRYLVHGQRPTDRTNANLTAGYSKLIGQASDLAVEPMSLPKLLDRLGYESSPKPGPAASQTKRSLVSY
jgi:hypothetical protein